MGSGEGHPPQHFLKIKLETVRFNAYLKQTLFPMNTDMHGSKTGSQYSKQNLIDIKLPLLKIGFREKIFFLKRTTRDRLVPER